MMKSVIISFSSFRRQATPRQFSKTINPMTHVTMAIPNSIMIHRNIATILFHASWYPLIILAVAWFQYSIAV